MAEPKYHFTTEVSEEAFRRALRITCPKQGMIEFFLLALLWFLFGMDSWLLRSNGPKIDLAGIIYFVLGIYFLLWVVWLPMRHIKDNLQRRRMETGKVSIREELEFLEEEILLHNLDLDKTQHIPYSYITKIYLLDDMLVYVVDQNTGMGQIMRQDILNEQEFIPWLISRCSHAKIKNRSKK